MQFRYSARLFYTVALIVATLCLASYVGIGRLHNIKENNRPPLIGNYLSEDVVVNELHLQPDGSTMLVALRSGCHYCEQEKPFYNRLIALTAMQERKDALHFVTPDPEALFGNFLPAAAPKQISNNVPLWIIGVDSTPTILVVRNRRIEKAWFGMISDLAGEEDIKNELLRIGGRTSAAKAYVPSPPLLSITCFQKASVDKT